MAKKQRYTKNRSSRLKLILLIPIALIVALIIWKVHVVTKPLRIGVLLNMSGQSNVDSRSVLDWAQQRYNQSGGIGGRQIELVYEDENNHDFYERVREFLINKSVDIVIGPATNTHLHDIAPLFIEKKKVLISPSATAGDIYRAYGGSNFIWRTVQSDVAQVRTMINLLEQKNVKKISLIYEDTLYGKTFFDWTGFFATEAGMNITRLESLIAENPNYKARIDAALTDNPEYIIAAVFPKDAVALKQELDRRNTNTKLFFANAARTDYFLQQLNQAAEGVEIMGVSYDPTTWFELSYAQYFHHAPEEFAANIYDAFLLATYALARNEHANRFTLPGVTEPVDESISKLNTTSGVSVSSDISGQSEAYRLLAAGEIPDISGTSGPLHFDKSKGVDPVETFYSYSVIKNGEFVLEKNIATKESDHYGALAEERTASETLGNEKFKSSRQVGTYQPKPRKGFKAVLVATSYTYENYRHQSDVLAMYQLLKSRGVSDENIILMLVDDIPTLPLNPLQGNVHYVQLGKNNRADANLDYHGNQVTAENLQVILTGKATTETPTVLTSDDQTDVMLYIVDHGAQIGEIPFDYGAPLQSGELAGFVQDLFDQKKFRQLLVVVEVCFGEAMGTGIQTPGVLFLTGTRSSETSFGTNYDADVKAWLGDSFSFNLMSQIAQEPSQSIEQLYHNVYERVNGSHVTMLNASNFSNISQTKISDFVSP